MILLQYTPPLPTVTKNPIGGEFDFAGLFNSGVLVSQIIQKVCIPVVAIAFLIMIFMLITKIYNEKQVDYAGFGRFFLLLFFLYEYSEIMTQFNNVVSYFSDNIGQLFKKYGSGSTVVDKINEVYNHYEKKNGSSLVSGLSNFWDWVIANCTHMVIIMTRGIILTLRSFILVFLLAVGPLAILFSMFPGFEGNMKGWFKWYMSTAFWSITLGILDLLLFKYLDYCITTNSLEGVTTVNIVIALMYLLVPVLTTMYINSQTSTILNRMMHFASAVKTMASSFSKAAGPGMKYIGSKTLSKFSESTGGKAGDSILSTTGRLAGNMVRNVSSMGRKNF